jgi:hypothetical protein
LIIELATAARAVRRRCRMAALKVKQNQWFHDMSRFCNCDRKGTVARKSRALRWGSIDLELALDCIVGLDTARSLYRLTTAK